MAETKTEKKKSGLNPLLAIGCGCLVLLMLLGIGLSIFGGWIAKKVGVSFFQGMIEQKTGIKTNLSDLEKGKMTFTDPKTGANVDLGTGKIPESFPKDFPMYPGVKVLAALSGNDKGDGSGFWLTLSTPDSLEKVSAFYKSELVKKGWEVTADYSTGNMVTQGVKKGEFKGSVSVTREADAKETALVIVLEEEKEESAR